MKNPLNSLLATHGIAALEAANAGPPSEFRIWKAGLNTITDGRPPLLFDAEAAKDVMEAYTARGMDVVSDYEHQALQTPPVKAPAAGWFNLEIRDGELWATNVRWTETAAAHIKAGEYRFFSPTFYYQEAKIEKTTVWRPWFMITCSLTNTPAMEQLDPLAGFRIAGHRTKDLRTPVGKHGVSLSFGEIRHAVWDALNHAFPDDWPCIEAIYDDNVVFELMLGTLYRVGYSIDGITAVLGTPAKQVRRIYEDVAGGDMQDIIAALGIDLASANTQDKAVFTAGLASATKFLTELETLTGKKSAEEVLGTLRAWKDNSGRAAEFSVQVETDKADKAVKALLAEFSATPSNPDPKKRKVLPAMVPGLEAMGKQGLAGLRAYIEASPVVAALSTPEAQAPQGGGSGTPAGLVDGKKWEDFKPGEKAELFHGNRAAYNVLKTEYETRTGTIVG